MTVALKKDIINAVRTKKSNEKLIYFTYPSASDDGSIHIKDISEKIYIYMGESKGGVVKYTIDTDTKIDTNLNGDVGDDTDNQ